MYRELKIQEADLPGLLQAGRLVMRRSKLFQGVEYKVGARVPVDIRPHRLMQLIDKRDVAILPEPIISGQPVAEPPAVAGKGKKVKP